MNTFTAQELFDKAYLGIIAQGRPAMTDTKGCAYRTTDGLKCAVGFIIDDETARIWDKFGSIEDVQEGLLSLEERLPEWAETHFDMLVEMQTIHDYCSYVEQEFISYYKYEMSKVAEKYGLKVPT
jgi:RNA processing factor Prp31